MRSLLKNASKAFTFLEIMVAVGIIGLIFGISAISYTQLKKGADDATRKADLEKIAQAVETYKSNNVFGSYPSDLDQVIPAGYLSSTDLTDPDGDEYSYEPSPSTPVACSPTVSTNICKSFLTYTVLDSTGKEYYVSPFGVITPTSSPTASPTSTATPTPLPPTVTPTPTRTPTPLPPANCAQACAQQGYTQQAQCRPNCSNSQTQVNYSCLNQSDKCCCK